MSGSLINGFTTTKDFSVREIMTVNMCASENTRAGVAIRARDNQGKVSGYTSSIPGNGDSVNVGKMGHDFDVKEIGVQSVVRKPNQFFEMKFAFDESGAITTIVDDRHNGGMSNPMEPNGKFGFFIAEGTLIIKSITVTQVSWSEFDGPPDPSKVNGIDCILWLMPVIRVLAVIRP